MAFEPIPPRLSLYEMQEEILRGWRQQRIFEQSVEQRPADKRYSFYDGPPFITGIPHYATLLPSIAKDVIPRFKTMQGYRVRRVWGWDCHGLPAETKVEKELGIKSKKDIEKLGIDKFVAACREYVSHVSQEWPWYIDHIGRWVDMEGAYRTMDLPYMESVLWVFKELYDKGLVYQGLRSSLYCTRCATPLSKFEITMDDGFYREVADPAVALKFKLKDKESYLLAWTTTPWTLPGNRALAVNEEATYVEVKTPEREIVILGANAFERAPEKYGQEVRRLPAQELVGLSYEPLYEFGEATAADFKVYAAAFVSTEEGTGIVHVAPAFGEDDFSLGQAQELTMTVQLDEEGHFLPDTGPFSGLFYKKVNKLVIEDLTERGRLFANETIVHSYPFCYRCETPLIYKAQEAWYLKIDALRQELLETNEDINWVPPHFKQGRFKHNLETAPDWSLSRSRYWGTPLPIWRCEECQKIEVMGSVAEIEAKSGQPITDLHRPNIDAVTWAHSCGGAMRRIPEVFDVWFESGSMPYGERHYPFENKEEFRASFPADFVVEYTGQLRGWFYYLHVLANALFQSPAFKNVVVTGVMKGNDGRKMSKSFGNYPDPKATIQKYGGEALRLYFMSSPIMMGEDMNVTEEDLQDHYRKTLMIVWNSYQYFVTYANRHDFTPAGKKSGHILDQWLVAQVEQLAATVEDGLNQYDYVTATRAIRPFVEGLSTWYIRRSRARFVAGDTEALETLYAVLVRFAAVAAPILPFTAESMYLNLVLNVTPQALASVHLTDWQEADRPIIADSQDLLTAMKKIQALAHIGQSLRQEAKLPVRQALPEFQVQAGDDTGIPAELAALLADELNVKQVKTVPALAIGEKWLAREENGVTAALNIEVTAELKEEGLAREIIRHGQVLRRKAGYALEDRISLLVVTDSEEIKEVLAQHKDMIRSVLQAGQILTDKTATDVTVEVKVGGHMVSLGVVRQ